MTLEVKILDRSYKLGCEPHEKEQLQHAATMLNNKLNTARIDMPRIENERLIALIALNLMQDVLNLNKSLQEQTTCQRLLKQLILDAERALESNDTPA